MKVAARITEGMQSVVHNGRNHAVVTDLPQNQNGTDKGATALELSVMALATCITTIWAVVANNSKVAYSEFAVDIDAQKGDKTISEVKIHASVTSAEDRAKLERTLGKVKSACPVGVLFEKAGVSIETELTVNQ